VVIIECLDEHTHTHDIQESFRTKKPSILQDYIKSEIAKNSFTAQIYHAVRGAGTHEGSEQFASFTGNTYFHANTYSILILKSKS